MFGTVKSQKPFLKWVGGKYKLLNKTLKSLPEEINNYHEVFLGGGSVLLAILSLQKANKIQINGNIYAQGTKITHLPKGAMVTGHLIN